MSAKKPMSFIRDIFNDLQLISRNAKEPHKCVQNCRGMQRSKDGAYCFYCNRDLHIIDGKIHRDKKCIDREFTADEVCTTQCACKQCKSITDCCALLPSIETCSHYKNYRIKHNCLKEDN